MAQATIKASGLNRDDSTARNIAPCSPALDEAFAVLSDLDMRVDAGQDSSQSSPDWAKQAAPLIEKIHDQMVSLDEQRQRLNQLLKQLSDSDNA